jgi:hypothetical protein
MQPHEDATSPNPEDQMFNASFSLYLNDDFEGGELEFLDIPVKIKPKAGMLMLLPKRMIPFIGNTAGPLL